MQPELPPNHSKPALEIQRPKITVSAGRSPAPTVSREVSFHSERQQENSWLLGIHAGAAHSQPTWPGLHSSSTFSRQTQCNSHITRKGPMESPCRGGQWEKKELPSGSRAPSITETPRVEGTKLHNDIATMHPAASHFLLWQIYRTVRHK